MSRTLEGKVSAREAERQPLRTVADVDAVIRAGRARLVPPHVVLTVEPAETTALERQLNRDADACGCGGAAVAASLACFGYLTYLFAALGAPPRWDGRRMLLGVAVVVVAALLGKAVGLIRARRRWLDGLLELRLQILVSSESARG